MNCNKKVYCKKKFIAPYHSELSKLLSPHKLNNNPGVIAALRARDLAWAGSKQENRGFGWYIWLKKSSDLPPLLELKVHFLQ